MAVKITGLWKSYGEKTVLQDFSAVFEEGMTTCLMAPSGRGKTTLLRILMGLEQADRGKVEGMEGRKPSAVFQEDRLCENLSTGANIRLTASGKNGRSRAFQKQLKEGLLRMGLADCMNQPVRELSGGMRRRTAILRALYADWDILFLDEPFQGLDMETKKEAAAFVREQCREKTVLCVTHDEREAEMLDAKILVL